MRPAVLQLQNAVYKGNDVLTCMRLQEACACDSARHGLNNWNLCDERMFVFEVDIWQLMLV
jgi:hypothetical protein